MSAKGFIQVRAYTSSAQIPLQNVSIIVTDAGGTAIAMRLTNRSGILETPIEIEVPDVSAGQSPNTGIIPFTAVDLIAHLDDFEQIRIERLQVFPNVITTQDLEMIPLSELPSQWSKEEIFDTPAQNL